MVYVNIYFRLGRASHSFRDFGGLFHIVPTIAGLRSADQGFNLTQDRLGLLNLNLRRVSTLEDRRLGEVPG